MKFLLFNLIVAGALVYLFGAGPATTVVTDGVDAMAAHVDKIKAPILEPGSGAAPNKPEPRQEVENPEPALSAPPPIAETKTVRSLPEHAVPPPARTETEPAAKAEAAKFMTPKERWRELNRLAHDMELMYANKTAR